MFVHELEFMSEWCAKMKKLFADTRSEVTVWRWGPHYEPFVQFSIRLPIPYPFAAPNRMEIANKCRMMREGLSLFIAIARIDTKVLVQVLNRFVCELEEEYCDDAYAMDVLPVAVEVKLVNFIHNLDAMKDGVVAMCSQLGPHNTGVDFREAWMKIEAFSKAPLALSVTVGSSINGFSIPVRLAVSECNSGAAGIVLTRAWEIIASTLDCDQVSWGWASSRLGNMLNSLKTVRQGFYTSFILDSTSVSDTDKNSSFLAETYKVFAESIRNMCGHVSFSRVAVSLIVEPKNESAAVAVYQMVSSLLLCRSGGQCFSNAMHVDIQPQFQLRFGKAILTALAQTDSCGSICVSTAAWAAFGLARAEIWQWLAYALFSKRALRSSSVRRIKLTEVRLTTDDVEAVTKVLQSENPEQILFNSEMEPSVTVPSEAEYQVNEDTIVQMYDVTGNVLDVCDIFRGNPVCGVKIVGDYDKKSEWVDVMIPGVGFCEVQQKNLVRIPSEHTPKCRRDLQLEMEVGFSPNDGLCGLIKLIGPSLRYLRLTLYNNNYSTPAFDLSWIIPSCPRLIELTIKNRRIAADTFVEACERNHSRLSKLQVFFDKIHVLTDTLKDESHPLSVHLRWWYCYMYSGEAQPLQEMLGINRSLRNLTVATFKQLVKPVEQELAKYAGQTLGVEEEPFPAECKAAFLSVLHSTCTSSPPKKPASGLSMRLPDVEVLAIVFQFASERAVRKIKVLRG